MEPKDKALVLHELAAHLDNARRAYDLLAEAYPSEGDAERAESCAAMQRDAESRLAEHYRGNPDD